MVTKVLCANMNFIVTRGAFVTNDASIKCTHWENRTFLSQSIGINRNLHVQIRTITV